MNRLKMAFIGLFAFSFLLLANAQKADSTKVPATPDTTLTAAGDTLTADSAMALIDADLAGPDEMGEGGGLHKQLKQKFIEGSAGFMSLVALALVLGLAFCIERIVYLTLSEVNTRKLMDAVDAKLGQDDVEGAKNICRDTRGPVASMIAKMEKGCTWIRLFIAVAPSLGFLGTVIGMVMAFDQIQMAGDISPTIVAKGMKVALITTIFGIVVAIVLQFFYNYILAKIERLTAHMEECAIILMDAVTEYKMRKEK